MLLGQRGKLYSEGSNSDVGGSGSAAVVRAVNCLRFLVAVNFVAVVLGSFSFLAVMVLWLVHCVCQ